MLKSVWVVFSFSKNRKYYEYYCRKNPTHLLLKGGKFRMSAITSILLQLLITSCFRKGAQKRLILTCKTQQSDINTNFTVQIFF